VAGDPFQVTVHARSGAGTLRNAGIALTVPSGWTVSGTPTTSGSPELLVPSNSETTTTFTVTPAAGATADQYKIAARLASGTKSGYTDNVVQIVPPAEGRFHRWGKYAE